jgi:ATP-dependent Clp protease protease subunit
MGLLLRERIVFLGNEIEDFLADAVVSQLLLLDAIDPDSDIRLFVNSSGGSLRYGPLFLSLPRFPFQFSALVLFRSSIHLVIMVDYS